MSQLVNGRCPPMVVPASISGPIRVLMWAPKGAGLHYGGPGMTLYRLFARAQADRFEITLLHGLPEQERYPCFAEQHFLSKMPTNASSFCLWEFRAHRWLRRHACEFDVFLGVQGWHFTVSAAVFANRLGLPAAVRPGAFRTDFVDKSGWNSCLGLPAWRRARLRELSAVIAVSKDISEEVYGYGVPREKIAYIPNAVDIDLFRPATDTEKRRTRIRLAWPDVPTVLFSGALVRRKRPDLLVEAAALLKRRGIDIHVVFMGPEYSGGTADEIKRRCEKLKLGDQISFLGFRRNVPELYRAADIFCLPSHSEGMANAMLEAMASGLPCIVTNVSGVRDVLEDQVHGMIVNHSADEIADAIGAYVRDPKLAPRHGAAGRELILNDYNADAMLDRYEGVFRSMMSSRVTR